MPRSRSEGGEVVTGTLEVTGAVDFDSTANFDGAATLNDTVVINETGADKDTRVEGDTDANLFFVDASTDRVGVGTATPSVKLDVNGAANVTGATTLVGSVTVNDAGADIDVRMEGDNDANLFMLDASVDRVGFGVLAPLAKVHVKENSGNFGFFNKSGVVGSEITLLATNVTKGCSISGIAVGSGGTVLVSGFGAGIATPGAASTSVVVNTITFKLYSTGQLVVFRSSGTETYSISLIIVWE